jgi:NAD+ kinase
MKVAVRGDRAAVESAVGVVGGAVVPEDGDADADAVVAVGEAAVRSAVDDRPTAPLLPVTDDGGRHLVARSSLTAALTAVASGETRVRTHPVLACERDGTVVGHAVREVTLMTARPGTISEYSVVADDGRLASVRADGVVVAPPLGSDRYAAAAGGAVVGPGSGVAVVPVAPFSTATDTWVVDPARGVEAGIEREGEVAVVVDGVRRADAGRGTTVRVERAGGLDIVAVPETGARRRTETF